MGNLMHKPAKNHPYRNFKLITTDKSERDYWGFIRESKSAIGRLKQAIAKAEGEK